MGEVYRAFDPKLQRQIAIKIVRSDGPLATDGTRRVLREARAVAALSHPNVLAIFDAGEVTEPEKLRGIAYITMELVVGRTLRAYVGDATVPMERRLEWLASVARALDAAHKAGLVHRDVKPENVMLTLDGAVKVVDFGIARTMTSFDVLSSTEGHSLPTLTAVHAVTGLGETGEAPPASSRIVGTLDYMAPEQLRGESLDGRTDQFAWGVVAYELLTGVRPWSADDPIPVVSQILEHTPRPPHEVDPAIPAAMSGAIMRALAKSATARFPSMNDLLATPSLGAGSGAPAQVLVPSAVPMSPSNPLADPDDLPRGARVGRYEILERLGAGAMGTVYAAHDPNLDRRVALKLIRAQVAGPELELRLLREAKAMARLSHPEIVSVYDAGRDGDRIFIAMELVVGSTLRKWLADRPRAWREIVAIYARAGRGLAQAHASGIVHRDFKPDNVLIGDDGRVRVTDFGLARSVREEDAPLSSGTEPKNVALDSAVPAPLTRTGTLAGTPAYMGPEQLDGTAVDARSDIYAFCVALYEAVYGELPFGSTSLLAHYQEKKSGAIHAPSAPGDVPARVRRLLLVGLRPQPENRYASMEELLRGLDRATKRSPIDPRRQAGVAAILVLLAVGAFASLRWLRHGNPGPSAPTMAGASAASASPVTPRLDLFERPVLKNADVLTSLSLSPDAETDAYIATREAEEPAAYTQSVRGEERARIAPPPGASKGEWSDVVGFFPDGSLLMEWSPPRGHGGSLWKIRIADGSMQPVGHPQRPADSTRLSPDGRLLLVARAGRPYVEPLEGDGSTAIADEPAEAAWSPGSDMVVYATTFGKGNGAIQIASVDGKRRHPLLEEPHLVSQAGQIPMAWPEPHRLLWVRQGADWAELVESGVDDLGQGVGAPRVIHSWSDTGVSEISAAGGAIAFLKLATRQEVSVGTLAKDLGAMASPMAPIAKGETADQAVGWLDDGRVLFLSKREGMSGLYARGGAGEPSALIARGVRSARQMSTGEVLGWTEENDAGTQCALVRIDANGVHPLLEAPAKSDALIECNASMRCTRASDRRQCVVSRLDGFTTTWWPVDIETGRKGAPLFHASREHDDYVSPKWSLSPDAKTLAILEERRRSMRFVTLDSGDSRLVRFNREFRVQQFDYTPDGRHLVIGGYTLNGPFALATSDLDGHVRVVAEQPEWISQLRVSPEGRQVAVAERRFETRLWMIAPQGKQMVVGQ